MCGKVSFKIAEGSECRVFCVSQTETNEKTVFKRHYNLRLHEQICPGILRYKEMDVLSRLDHPNIIKIKDVVLTPRGDGSFFSSGKENIDHRYKLEKFYLKFDYYKKDLRQLLKESFMSDANKFRIMYQCLSAIYYIHSKNIIHGDIKPSNILVKIDDEGKINIVLIDFGHSQNMNRFKKITYIGTDKYQAPEIKRQLDKREGDFNEKIDIYSLGFTFIRLILGYEKEYDIDDIKNERLRMIIISMLDNDPEKRPSAWDILSDEYFKDHESYGLEKQKEIISNVTTDFTKVELPDDCQLLIKKFLKNGNDNFKRGVFLGLSIFGRTSKKVVKKKKFLQVCIYMAMKYLYYPFCESYCNIFGDITSKEKYQIHRWEKSILRKLDYKIYEKIPFDDFTDYRECLKLILK